MKCGYLLYLYTVQQINGTGDKEIVFHHCRFGVKYVLIVYGVILLSKITSKIEHIIMTQKQTISQSFIHSNCILQMFFNFQEIVVLYWYISKTKS